MACRQYAKGETLQPEEAVDGFMGLLAWPQYIRVAITTVELGHHCISYDNLSGYGNGRMWIDSAQLYIRHINIFTVITLSFITGSLYIVTRLK